MSKEHNGFTLIELVISIGIAVILLTVVIIMIDPVRQFANARNNQRWSHITTILNAVGQNMADNKGSFSCVSGPIPTTTKRMTVGAGNYDIANCLIPNYLINLPFDPATTSAHYASTTDYDTGYSITQNATSGRITIAAPAAELGQSISITR